MAHSFANSGKSVIASAISVGILGALLGSGNEGAEKIEEVFYFQGLPSSEIQSVLEKLRKKARVSNFQ